MTEEQIKTVKEDLAKLFRDKCARVRAANHLSSIRFKSFARTGFKKA